ncbi:MAG TPA: hypothetical protein PLB12_10855, partial [Candidatus Goldiibacteriota bacterium]|nr:hypothetical protein [Candidatus Goldiibacteriota bacterium]
MGYLSKLEEARKAAGKAGPESFKNDYSGIYYIVNNYQRARQVQQKIESEMRASTDKKVISPPDIADYKSAFLYIAVQILLGGADRSNITEFSNEWIGFFMADIALNAVTGSKVYDKQKRTENIRMNLSAEYAAFLFDIEEYECVDKMEALKGKYAALEPEKHFFAAYDEYMKRRKAHSNPNKFFDRISAFTRLKEYLKDGGRVKEKTVIIVEDKADMEPLYITLLDLLGKAGVIVMDVNRQDYLLKGAAQETALYHYMTPLDEAEGTAYAIKKLIKNGVAPEDIAVAVFGSDSAESLRFALERFGISHATKRAISGHHAFTLFADAINFAVCEPEKADAMLMARQLLGNETSALKPTSYSYADKVFSIIASLGKAAEGEAGCVKLAEKLESIGGPFKDDTKGAAQVIKDRKSLLNEGFGKLFDNLVDKKVLQESEAAIILAEAAEMLDRQLPGFTATAENIFKLKAALRSIGNMEYEAEEGKSAGYVIPFMQDKKVFNINAVHYFICGLDAGIDRRQMISG